MFSFDSQTIAAITSITALVSCLAALLNVIITWLAARFNSHAAYRLEASKLYFSALSCAVLYCTEPSREALSLYGQALVELAHDRSDPSVTRRTHAQVSAQIAMQQELSALRTIKLK